MSGVTIDTIREGKILHDPVRGDVAHESYEMHYEPEVGRDAPKSPRMHVQIFHTHTSVSYRWYTLINGQPLPLYLNDVTIECWIDCMLEYLCHTIAAEMTKHGLVVPQTWELTTSGAYRITFNAAA